MYGADIEVAEWVRRRISTVPRIEDMMPCSAIGVAKDGRYIAGLVFNNFRWPDIQVMLAADEKRWCTRHVIRAVHRYAFVQLGCLRVTGLTKDDNITTQKFMKHWGFVREGVHPYSFPDGSAGVSYGLYREGCRWLEETDHRQVIRSAAAGP